MSSFQVPGYEDVLVGTINLCVQYVEDQIFMLPKEKYILLKVSEATTMA